MRPPHASTPVRPRAVIGGVGTAAALVLGACFGGDGVAPWQDAGQDAGRDAGEDAGAPIERQVVIGVPDQDDELEFVPLVSGGDIALETFGQGGTHAELAVRGIGFGKRAFVVVTLENLVSGETVTTPEPARPQLLLCRDEAETICDLIPMFVLTGGLAEPGKKDGLRIRVTAEIRTPGGLMGETSIDGVLRANLGG